METENTPIKVLTSYYRPKPGGLCKRLMRAINAILEKGYVVHYLAVEKFPIDNQNCIYHRFPWPRKYSDTTLFWIAFHFFAPIQLFMIALTNKISHLFAFGMTYSFVLQPTRKILNLPLALFLRGDPLAAHSSNKRSELIILLDKFIEKKALYKVNLFSTSSALLKRVLMRNKNSKIESKHIFRNNIDVLYKPNYKKIYDSINLSCVGTIDPVKNQVMLLRVMEELSSDNCTLNIYGNGKDENLIRDIIAHKKLTDKVILHGWCDADTIWRNTDILLMPSVHEGSPNAILECLGYGIPVLASDIPEHREILHSEGVIELNDIQAWVKKIRKIINSPQLEITNLIIVERKLARKLVFDWDQYVVKNILNRLESSND